MTIRTSTSPEILIFGAYRDFKHKWQFIDRDNFMAASTDPSGETLVAAFRPHILEFAKKRLLMEQPRYKFRECLELPVILVFCLRNSAPEQSISRPPLTSFKRQRLSALDRQRFVQPQYHIDIVLYRIFVILEENIVDRMQQMEQVSLTKVNTW